MDTWTIFHLVSVVDNSCQSRDSNPQPRVTSLMLYPLGHDCSPADRQLQLIQNAAARILTRTRKSEHITPVLRSLHWLLVTLRIDFKLLLLVYKSLNGLGPKYIADMLTEYKPNRPLRSVGLSQLEIPRVHTKQGESAFSYFAARSHQLPEEIKCAKTLATFKYILKTHLFSCAFVEWALCYVRTDCTI